MNILSLDQLSYKAASQRRTECSVYPAIKVICNILFNLLSDSDHIKKDQIAAIKSIVIDTDQVILIRQPVQYRTEIRLIIAGRSRQQKQHFARHEAHFIKLHCASSSENHHDKPGNDRCADDPDQSQDAALFEYLRPGLHERNVLRAGNDPKP